VDFFADRFADQAWMIFDLNRSFGIGYDREALYYSSQCPPLDPESGRLQPDLLAEGELLYQEAWSRYFTSIAISERANPRQQLNYMPRRFWPLLTEKQQR
jgi:probable DNA metabolism protein